MQRQLRRSANLHSWDGEEQERRRGGCRKQGTGESSGSIDRQFPLSRRAGRVDYQLCRMYRFTGPHGDKEFHSNHGCGQWRARAIAARCVAGFLSRLPTGQAYGSALGFRGGRADRGAVTCRRRTCALHRPPDGRPVGGHPGHGRNGLRGRPRPCASWAQRNKGPCAVTRRQDHRRLPPQWPRPGCRRLWVKTANCTPQCTAMCYI